MPMSPPRHCRHLHGHRTPLSASCLSLLLPVLLSYVAVAKYAAADDPSPASLVAGVPATDAVILIPMDVPDNTVLAAAYVWTIALLLLLLSVLAAVYVQPSWIMDLVVRYSHPCVLWCVATSSRVCALTVDDAPSPHTSQILDLLRDHNVKATFFIISDQIQGNEEVVRRIVREGHRLGNHLTEDRASIRDELHVFEQKLRECDAAITSFQPSNSCTSNTSNETDALPSSDQDESDLLGSMATIPTATTRLLGPITSSSAAIATTTYSSSASSSTSSSKWLRPASGWFTSNMREIVQSHGYKICMGSVYPHDAQIKSPWLNALFLRLRTRPGSVLIVHDRVWTISVLRDALPELTRTFTFVSLDELTQHQHQHQHQHQQLKPSHKVKNVM